jgi:hypothetical protein
MKKVKAIALLFFAYLWKIKKVAKMDENDWNWPFKFFISKCNGTILQHPKLTIYVGLDWLVDIGILLHTVVGLLLPKMSKTEVINPLSGSTLPLMSKLAWHIWVHCHLKG